MQIKAVGPVP